VASIDHTDSTYRTQAAFGSILVNRSLDQLFVLEKMAQMAGEGCDFTGLYDADNTGSSVIRWVDMVRSSRPVVV
jgi:hypothetical protein